MLLQLLSIFGRMCYSLQVSMHIPVFSQGAQNSRGVRKHSTAGCTVSTSCFFSLTQWFKVLRRLDSAHTWVPTREIFILGTTCLLPPCHFHGPTAEHSRSLERAFYNVPQYMTPQLSSQPPGTPEHRHMPLGICSVSFPPIFCTVSFPGVPLVNEMRCT